MRIEYKKNGDILAYIQAGDIPRILKSRVIHGNRIAQIHMDEECYKNKDLLRIVIAYSPYELKVGILEFEDMMEVDDVEEPISQE